MNKKFGLYGGFFNPFHEGHLHVIQSSMQYLSLQKLFVLPTYQNPLKENIHQDSIQTQIKNLRDNLSSYPVKVSDFEYRHSIQSTHELLKKIQTKCSLDRFYLIMGLDQLGQLHLWKNYQWIIENISICVIYRPRYDKFIENSEIFNNHPHLFMQDLNTFINSSTPLIHLLKNDGVDMSSSEIRNS
jgi:nicotinate (nicotinamide) nucleotide adenylyltransferase